MVRNGFFTGLDIGTSSIKVLVTEFINGEMNVIGVSNVKSAGVKDGIIVDIDVAATTIKTAIAQAEEKAGVSIDKVSVSLPANLLQIEPTQGMIPVQNETKEIRDEDVNSVVKSALTKSITPDREVITLIPEEFIIDGFQGIKDPRGMMGTRLEMRGILYTGPSTILHNLRRAVEKAGIGLETTVISPLALTKTVLNEGEREFGATVIDMGGGQTTIASMRNQELQHTNVYSEGGDYVTKDISKVLQTSRDNAEALKFNFGNADVDSASAKDSVKVDVIGDSKQVEVTERYLSEVISARIRHILERVKQDLDRKRLLEMPGGIVLSGGGAILPGVVELAEKVFGVNVKLFIPSQVGIRNPMFANVISLVDYVGHMTDVDMIAQKAVENEELLRRKPVEIQQTYARETVISQPKTYPTSTESVSPVASTDAPAEFPKKAKPKVTESIRNLFGSMFD